MSIVDTPVKLGVDPFNQNREFDGILDDVRIYDRAIDESEVKAIHTMTNGLPVAYWSLENTNNDISATGNDLTWTGDLTYINAKIGTGLDLDGTGDYGTSANTVGISGSSPWSFALWVYPRSNPSDDYGKGLVSWGDNTGTNTGNFLYYNSDEATFEYGFWANDAQTAGNYPAYRWYHVVNTYDGTTQKVYIDGVEADSRAVGALSIVDTAVKVGTDPFEQGREFDGILDEVRIFDYALSDSEISALFNATP